MDIHSACALGDLDWIQRTLSTDRSALDQQVDTYYPLQYTIPRRPEVLRLLMAHGDDPNRPIRKVGWFFCEDQAVQQGLEPWRPIHMVALHGYHENSVYCAETLNEFGADLNAESPLRGVLPPSSGSHSWLDPSARIPIGSRCQRRYANTCLHIFC